MPKLKKISKEKNRKYQELRQDECEGGGYQAKNEEDFLFGTEDSAQDLSVVERRNKTIRRVRVRSCCSRKTCIRFTCTCYALCACLALVAAVVMVAPYVLHLLNKPGLHLSNSAPGQQTIVSSGGVQPSASSKGPGHMNSSTPVFPAPTPSSSPSAHFPTDSTTTTDTASTVLPEPTPTTTVHNTNSTVPIAPSVTVTSSLSFPIGNSSTVWLSRTSTWSPLPSPSSAGHTESSAVTVDVTTAQPQPTSMQPPAGVSTSAAFSSLEPSSEVSVTSSKQGWFPDVTSLSERISMHDSMFTALPAASSSALQPETTTALSSMSSLSVEIGSARLTSPSPSPTSSPAPRLRRSADEQEVCAPLHDTSLYRVITLDNSLRVLLVSNNQTSISAAAVDVNSGYFDDGDISGLAHFCEHMLFLGTEKYPGEGEYSNYLSTNGGYNNAYTSSEHTNYFFSVNNDKLEGAMDRLAQFFVSPLFSESGVDREKNAVNSEYERNKGVAAWTDYQITKTAADPRSVFSRYGGGSLETFNVSNLVEELHRYYQSRYSANMMQLAVYGKEDLDTLQNWAETYFTDIPNKNLRISTVHSAPFPADLLTPRIIPYKPLGSIHTLRWLWQSPSLQSHARLNLDKFLDTLFTYTASGSILDHLQGLGWASSVSFYIDNFADFSVPSLHIDLTQAGQSNIADVVSAVFSYISFLRSSSEEDLERVWRALKGLQQIKFDNPDPPSNVPFYTSDLATKMRTTEHPADFLSPPQRFIWDYDLLRATLDSLVPHLSNIFYTNPSVSLDKTLAPESHSGPCSTNVAQVDGFMVSHVDQLEHFFEIPYGEYCVPSNMMEQWKSIQPLPSARLPQLELFLPKDFSLHPPPPSSDTTPELVQSSQGYSVWWMPDAQFRNPVQIVKCGAKTRVPGSSPYYAALSAIYKSYFSLILSEIKYYADLAGYKVTFDLSHTGLTVDFQGFSDQSVMTTFIETVLNTTLLQVSLPTLSSRKDKLDLALNEILQKYRNYNTSNVPYQHTRDLNLVVQEDRRYYYKDILYELEKIAASSKDFLAHVAAFAKKTLSSISDLTCYATGNVLKEQAISYSSLVYGALTSSGTPPSGDDDEELVKVLKLPRKVTAITVPTLNPAKDRNSAVYMVAQVGLKCVPVKRSNSFSRSRAVICSRNSIHRDLYSGVLNLLIKDACFDQLRTKEQLGYAVGCGTYTVDSTLTAVYFLVQSAVQPPSYVLNRTWEFIRSFQNTVKNKTVYNQAVEAYKNILRAKDKTLMDQVNRVWTEITTRQLRFNKNQELLKAMDALTHSGYKRFYNRFIMDSSYDGTSHQSVRQLVVGAFQNVSAVHFDQIPSDRQFTLEELDKFKSNDTRFW